MRKKYYAIVLASLMALQTPAVAYADNDLVSNAENPATVSISADHDLDDEITAEDIASSEQESDGAYGCISETGTSEEENVIEEAESVPVPVAETDTDAVKTLTGNAEENHSGEEKSVQESSEDISVGTVPDEEVSGTVGTGDVFEVAGSSSAADDYTALGLTVPVITGITQIADDQATVRWEPSDGHVSGYYIMARMLKPDGAVVRKWGCYLQTAGTGTAGTIQYVSDVGYTVEVYVQPYYYSRDTGFVHGPQSETRSFIISQSIRTPAGTLYLPGIAETRKLYLVDNTNKYNSQNIVDDSDSAAYITTTAKPVIADHCTEGKFLNIGAAVAGKTHAYIRNTDGSITDYICVSSEVGHNEDAGGIGLPGNGSGKSGLTDSSGTSLFSRSNFDLAMYTCSYTNGRFDSYNVIIATWKKVGTVSSVPGTGVSSSSGNNTGSSTTSSSSAQSKNSTPTPSVTEPATEQKQGNTASSSVSQSTGSSVTPSPASSAGNNRTARTSSNGSQPDGTRKSTTDVAQKIVSTCKVYRLYNPYSGEHFYTASKGEKNTLIKIGWKYEGVGWTAVQNSNGSPVYRLYNPNASKFTHHYTMSAAERDWLVSLGWRYEGISWYSNTENSKPVYRLYNPKTGEHLFTLDANEKRVLSSRKRGWNYEGISWFGV